MRSHRHRPVWRWVHHHLHARSHAGRGISMDLREHPARDRRGQRDTAGMIGCLCPLMARMASALGCTTASISTSPPRSRSRSCSTCSTCWIKLNTSWSQATGNTIRCRESQSAFHWSPVLPGAVRRPIGVRAGGRIHFVPASTVRAIAGPGGRGGLDCLRPSTRPGLSQDARLQPSRRRAVVRWDQLECDFAAEREASD